MDGFEQKRLIQIDEINRMARDAVGFVTESETRYEARIADTVSEIEKSGCRAVMLSGPSGSGKTTSSLKLAAELRSRGHRAEVISLDDFFKNIADYPNRPDGSKDLESIYALDVETVNERLYSLVRDGRAEIPQFDFPSQSRKKEARTVELGENGVAVVEGIHALNPLLTGALGDSDVFRIYAGLREEFGDGTRRVVATRDLRIARRLVRDFYFRGYSVERTLEVWDGILEGEEIWVKVFKDKADTLLDTSFTYEPCVLRPFLDELFARRTEGGGRRSVFEGIVAEFSAFLPVDESAVPGKSMLREFLGGLEM